MKVESAHAITNTLAAIHWEKIPQGHVDILLAHPNALRRFFTDFLSGKIKFDPDQMVEDYVSGSVEIKR